jgi:hypothetical protein
MELNLVMNMYVVVMSMYLAELWTRTLLGCFLPTVLTIRNG